ncbi:MAG: isochorismatase family cysteine hydrolase [Porticoccaceae bacterium]|nr:cysteine hydrolase [Pseudomonadales bacterium]MCP5173433.1 cysteine hydrolase [Pseudomonadales bacterium]MCP5303246.1 cysteine hydrolase [Pseudomonadales bacterium]
MHQINIPEFALERGRKVRPELSLNPSKTAVIAIDLQRFFIDEDQPMGNPHTKDILDNVNRINAALRQQGGLVVFTQHSFAKPGETVSETALASAKPVPGSRSFELHPDLVVSDGDVRLVKHQSSPLHPMAFSGLGNLLRERAIESLVVCGFASNGCCDCTARDAAQYGYQVVVASDATAAVTDEEHNAALMNLAIYYASVQDTGELIQLIMGRS